MALSACNHLSSSPFLLASCGYGAGLPVCLLSRVVPREIPLLLIPSRYRNRFLINYISHFPLLILDLLSRQPPSLLIFASTSLLGHAEEAMANEGSESLLREADEKESGPGDAAGEMLGITGGESFANEQSDTSEAVDEQPTAEGRRELLELMRAQVETADPLSQGTDDATLERFLVTNSMDVKKAFEALLGFQKWRRSFAPLGYIPEEEIVNELKKGKLCLQGHDRKGRTIGVFLIVRHDAFDRDLAEFKRYIVYSFDKAVASTKNKLMQLVVIVDLAGWGYKSWDVRGYLALLDILQDHYINHLGKMILIHVPYIFWAAWKITSPFFNEFTKERMIFVDDKDLKAVLLEEIDEDQIPDIYGGKLPLQPV